LWTVLFILGVAFPVSADTIDISIEPSDSPTAGAGDTVSLEVWLRNINGEGGASSAIESLELDFGVLPAGLSFVAGPAVADGFDENDAPIPSELDTILDGSLLDGHTGGLPDLSFVAFSTSGIAADASDRLVGTFWVKLDGDGPYTVSLDNAATSVLANDLSEYTKSFSDAVIPEPTSVSLLLIGFGVFLKRRRR